MTVSSPTLQCSPIAMAQARHMLLREAMHQLHTKAATVASLSALQLVAPTAIIEEAAAEPAVSHLVVSVTVRGDFAVIPLMEPLAEPLVV
jgi:hypothetical protein